jgi:16S rRNA (guanine966-N2)-methyltransferase
MRVVAGTLRGRRIEPPPDARARPTSDRVREASFNALASMNSIEGATVVDLFAGTGALGIEALSRGAAHATFVEGDAKMVAILRRNLETLDLVDRATVVPGRAEAALDGWAATAATFDIALLDPPYAFAGWPELLAALPARLALIESDQPPELAAPWGVVREKRYGGTLVTLVQRSP